MSNVIKAYSVRYDDVVKKTIDIQLKVNKEMEVRPMKSSLMEEQQGEFVGGIDALFVESIPSQEETTEKASEIIENANKEAQLIIDHAKQEAEQIKKDAFSSGTNKGYEEGILQAKKENQKIILEYEEKTRVLQTQYEEMLHNLEPEMAQIIASLVQKITGVVVEGKEEVILYLIQNSIKNMDRSNEYTIRVSNEDYEYVSMRKEMIEEAIGREVSIYFTEDVKLQKNQCLIETQLQVINCSLDIQLNNLITDLKLLGGI